MRTNYIYLAVVISILSIIIYAFTLKKDHFYGKGHPEGPQHLQFKYLTNYAWLVVLPNGRTFRFLFHYLPSTYYAEYVGVSYQDITQEQNSPVFYKILRIKEDSENVMLYDDVWGEVVFHIFSKTWRPTNPKRYYFLGWNGHTMPLYQVHSS